METAAPPNNPSDSVSLRPDRLIGRWSWIAIAGLAGALLALALSTTRAPIYQASAAMAIGVDYPRTEPLDLLAENRILDRVAALITSDTTLALVADRLDARFGPELAWSTPAALRAHVRLDRKAATWEFVGIADRPDVAADIAQIWLEVSLAELDEAMDHAWESLKRQTAPIALACSELSEGASSESFWECLATGPVLTDEQVSELRSELALSRGVLPVVSYQAVRGAVASETPVVWSRIPLVVGGAVAGMTVGVVLAWVVGPVGRSPRRRGGKAASGG